MSKKFDKKINQKISQTEIAPSASLWDKIEAELPEEKKKRGFFFLPFLGAPMFKTAIAASVMFLLGGFSTYYFMNNNGNAVVETNIKTQEKDIANKQNRILNNESNSITNTQNSTESFNKKEQLAKRNALKNTQKNQKQTTQFNQLGTKNEKQITNNQANILFANIAENNSSNITFGTSARDYEWVYDETTGAYSVQAKSLEMNVFSENESNNVMANDIFLQNKDEGTETSFMSIIEEEKEEKPEVLEKNEDEPVLKAFNSKSNRINYQGFWLGPQVGFEGIFVADEFYTGGSFGVDFGYDFGSSWGLQTGLKYAINSKTVQIEQDGNMVNYKSEFNSFHVPFYARYKFTKLTQSYSRPLSLNLIGGLDYAYADTKKIHQLGLNIGAEYDIFTQADLMFTLGVKGGMYNNLNVFKIDAPEKINRYNYMLNAYLSVRFIDWAKKD